jgi:hypothetical protein
MTDAQKDIDALRQLLSAANRQIGTLYAERQRLREALDEALDAWYVATAGAADARIREMRAIIREKEEQQP